MKSRWPELSYDAWKDTLATLHMWVQIVGKIRMAQEPLVNHWWNTTLYVTSRGLTTSRMPYKNGRIFQIDFDFIDHKLRINGCDGEQAAFPLEPMSTALFYDEIMGKLHALDIDIRIRTMPSEVPDGIPFDKDEKHRSYDRAAVDRFWRALLQIDRVFKIFRSRFIGKVSPVHLFWGAMDLAVTRFSGGRAPVHPGLPGVPDFVTQEGYSHEVSSAGFWPGGFGMEAMFYSYAYPEPPGYADAKIGPAGAAYNTQLKEFALPYEAVRTAKDQGAALFEFLQTTYEAAANLAKWDRAALERRSP